MTSHSAHGIDLLGPVADDHRWHANAGNGFAAAQVVTDWDAQHATCPQGLQRGVWMDRKDRHEHAIVPGRFRKPVCAACAWRGACTRSATEPRSVQVRERDHAVARQAARARQQTEVVTAQYVQRAGIAGTISHGSHTGDVRRSRSIGLVKTQLLHFLLGTALNVIRGAAWPAETPRARTRESAVARRAPASE
jgi:transposase